MRTSHKNTCTTNNNNYTVSTFFFSVCLCIHVATLDIPPGSTTVLVHNELSLLIFLFWLRVSEERGDGEGGRRKSSVEFSFELVNTNVT